VGWCLRGGFLYSELLKGAIGMRRALVWLNARRCGICVWLGFLVILVLAMFPPWVENTPQTENNYAYSVRLGHAPLFRPPPGIFYAEVDYRRMLTEIGAGESFVLALYLTWGRRKDSRL